MTPESPKSKIRKWIASRQPRMEKDATTVAPVPTVEEPKRSQPLAERQNDYDYDADQEPYVPVGLSGLLAATEKLLAVNRGLDDTDERDSQVFKKVFTTDRLISERIRNDVGGTRKKLLRMASFRKNLSVIPPLAFDDYTQKQLVNNPLSAPLEEINPMQLVESARRLTQMGPGGIRSSESITPEMQAVHPSQFGYLSGIEGPESERIGVDARLTWGTKIGSNGRIYQLLRNNRTGRLEYVSPADLDGKTVKLPQ